MQLTTWPQCHTLEFNCTFILGNIGVSLISCKQVADGKVVLAIEYKSASEVKEAAAPPPPTPPPPPPPPEPVKEEVPAPKQIDLLVLFPT